MKKIITLGIISCMLSSCYSGGFDWNNEHISEQFWYKRAEKCKNIQQANAKKILGTAYNTEIGDDIDSKCIQRSRYSFEKDTKYFPKPK